MFSDVVYKWLDTALDAGIKEAEFWEMTIAELERAMESKRRVIKAAAREQASLDYILADLIGRSVSRIYGSNNKLPEISEVYPSLFVSQEIEEQKAAKKDELSVIRFKQFVDTYNKRFIGGSNQK